MITRILVALDRTPHAPGVLALALEVADRFDADVFLFRCVATDQDFPAAASNASNPDPLPAFLHREALDEVASLARASERARKHPPLVRVGSPVATILVAAADVAADLIVIGGHGLNGLDHVLGTLTAAVANRASRNVLVVYAK